MRILASKDLDSRQLLCVVLAGDLPPSDHFRGRNSRWGYGYITWSRYQENLKLLALNGHGYETARASPPREGAALLQGRAICGRCGQYLRARYRDARGRLESWYVCDHPTHAHGLPSCQSIAGTPIDHAVGMLIAETMTPSAVAVALGVRREIEARHAEADALRCRAVERAQTDADLAQRRFMKVDPNNRLVADTLEADWNEKLRTLAKAREEREYARRSARLPCRQPPQHLLSHFHHGQLPESQAPPPAALRAPSRW